MKYTLLFLLELPLIIHSRIILINDTIGLSCKEIKQLLKLHNRYRSFIASGTADPHPPAEYMLEMYWSTKIQAASQKYANKCAYLPSPLEERDGMGENMYLFRGLTRGRPPLRRGVETWFNQSQIYDFGYPNEGKQIGQFLQLITQNTYLIGCGATDYADEYYYNTLLVCRYFPPAVAHAEIPYIAGGSDCEKFEMTKSKKFNDLCYQIANKEDPCKLAKREGEDSADLGIRLFHHNTILLIAGLILNTLMNELNSS